MSERGFRYMMTALGGMLVYMVMVAIAFRLA